MWLRPAEARQPVPGPHRDETLHAEPGLGDAIGHVGAVLFSPSDLALVAGPPGERRRFLDIVLSLAERDYLTALQRYRQVLRQRNALLKRGAHTASLAPWDEALVEFGSRVTTWRAKWIATRAAGFSDRYLAIGGTVPARLSYRSGIALEMRDVELGRPVGLVIKPNLVLHLCHPSVPIYG